ncbi:MAG TPA: LacI family DNA-binding transcriptional regulator [Devosiaceae bacterium]|nr:LacI family DNA-binding transcriptional regulator [Devosiaceae bacterium]
MVKISDVASEAGVSSATVSRALNNKASVNPEYVARVEAAAAKLGYRPNGVARNLRRKRSDLLALIISDIGNPFFTAVARGVEDVARRNGYSVLLCNADEDRAKEAVYLGAAEQQQVAGVILSPNSAATDVSRLRSASIPLVVIDRPLREETDAIMVHSREGARRATEHLIDAGWRRPACITGPEDAATARDRLDGYLDAVRANDLEQLYRCAAFRQRGGLVAAAELLDLETPPDALFVANAEMALGVLGEIKRRKLAVGQDIGLIMFDDTPWAQFVSPPMSVVAQPAYDIGAQAAEMLMQQVMGVAPGQPRRITLSTMLVVRESSRRLAP